MKCLRSTYVILMQVIMAAVFGACGEPTSVKPDNDRVLLSVGDSALRLSKVVARIPEGLSEADSTALFNNRGCMDTGHATHQSGLREHP